MNNSETQFNEISEAENKREEEQKSIRVVRSILETTYQARQKIDPQKTREIKENLGRISNLIINFDETLTATDTITEIIKKLKELDVIPDFEGKCQSFRERLKLEKAGKLPLEDQRGKIQYFYKEVIRGLDKETLEQVYNHVCEAIKLNPNLKKIISRLKQEGAPVRLFILSLNSNWLLEKYCAKCQEELKDAEIVGILGNQIKFNENGRVVGVYEHVTDENKKEFIPEGNLVLADNRETPNMLKAGINAVNVQADSYYERLFADAREYSRLSSWSQQIKEIRDGLDAASETAKEADLLIEDIESSQQESLDLRIEHEVKIALIQEIKNENDKNRKKQEFLNEFNPKLDKHSRRVYNLTEKCSQFLLEGKRVKKE